MQIRPTPCPAGTYAAPAGSDEESDCLACPAQQYCETPGLIEPTDNCAPGFVCVEGNNDRPGPYATTYSSSPLTSGKCTEGSYCTEGAAAPITCETTTYNNYEQATEC